jgi:hypothetical protein
MGGVGKKVSNYTWMCRIFFQGRILSTTGDSLIVSLFVEVAKQSSIKRFASFDHFGIFTLGLM